MAATAVADFTRVPRHVGFIPDGNRRWAAARGMPKREGYAAGVEPGLRLLAQCRSLGIEEVSIYGFTKENVRRASDQVEAFRASCVEFARCAMRAGVALLAVGDARSPLFPEALRPYAEMRSAGDIRVNLLVNYGWQWDLRQAISRVRSVARPSGRGARTGVRESGSGAGHARRSRTARLGSAAVSPVQLVVRWGGRRRLSGFLPMQCAYADFYVADSLWPDMRDEDFLGALAWYQTQDVTMGG